MSACTGAHAQWLRAQLSRHRRPRRPAGRGAQLFQELPDDRAGVWLQDAGVITAHGQAGRTTPRARRCSSSAPGWSRRRTNDVTPQLVRHTSRPAADTLCRLCTARRGSGAAQVHVRFFRLSDQERFGDSLETAKRLVVEAGLGWHRARLHGQPDARGARLAALVFCQPRCSCAGAGRRAVAARLAL